MATITKEGVLEYQKKNMGKKKYKLVYVVITPGALHIFKDANDAFPTKSIDLEQAALEPADKGKPFSFGVKTKGGKDDGKIWMFAGESDADANGWLEVVKQSQGQKFTMPPRKTDSQRTKGSLMFRAKKNISGKVATSALMKQKVLNEETRSLLDALVAVVEKVTDQKTAAEVEKQIIKMVLKGYFQYDKGTITMNEFKQIDGVLRKAFNQMDKLFGYYQVRAASQLTEAFAKTATMLQEASAAVVHLLEPHVRPENITKMKQALAVIADANFLYKVWDCASLEQDLLSLISAMNKYTQIEL
eukprot:Phypoly_transcript_14209.p1 GENE.Phypoly_transcript_14209~~Phypoly_transcript_14209.p1  ORF type:complete len:302 (+),score=62.86 Phypoly_transcript_14209:71-976(+)